MGVSSYPALDLRPQKGTEALGLVHATKRFPGVVAVDDVSLSVRAGEIHVLLGENGAGKSTIVGMFAGLQEPDEGHLTVGGQRVRLTSPAASLAAGISTVFQHAMLVPTLSVFENLVLGDAWWRRPPRAAIEARVAELQADYGLAVPLDAITGELSLGEQQQIEIARALLRNSRVLILDEATSMVTPAGAAELGARMRMLADRGLALIFITHKLSEAFHFGDRITVLKQGRMAGEISPDHLRTLDEAGAVEEMVRLMFGGGGRAVPTESRRSGAKGAVRLAVRGLSTGGSDDVAGLDGLSFEVATGEILGVAGIDGNGQKQLAEALAGQRLLTGGSIIIEGVDVSRGLVADRRRLGLRYLTDDRLHEGAIGAFPVYVNTVVKEIGKPPFWSGGFERTSRIRDHARALIREYTVRTPAETTPIGHLSGGNIQKVLLGRELSGSARIVVFNKPTYGLDMQNITASRRRIREIAEQGVAVVLISTDLDELIELADRIVVMDRGRFTGTVVNEQHQAEAMRLRIGRLMVGEQDTGMVPA